MDDETFMKHLRGKLKLLEMNESFLERSVNEGFSGGEKKNQVSSEETNWMMTKQKGPGEVHGRIGDRDILYLKEFNNVTLTIFEGGHEMIVPQALAMIPIDGKRSTQKLTILTIGDSNGAAETGWPNQLKKLFPFSTIINKSISGNTIGFDNLAQEKLNSIKNIDRYLDEAYIELGQKNEFDVILIGLGTNDTKKVFEKRQKEVAENLSVLVQKVKQLVSKNQTKIPEIVIISPSPMDELKVNQEKYGGGDLRIQKNNQQFKKVAIKNQVDFLDTYTALKKEISEKTIDGVHLNEKAQFEMASEIANYIGI
jgi:lysophospholipase L1-like esterase